MESKAQSLGSIWEAQALNYTESSNASISRTKTYQDFAPQTEIHLNRKSILFKVSGRGLIEGHKEMGEALR